MPPAEALAYAKQRHAFGRPIGEFQAITHALADIQTEVDAARLLVQRAAWMHDEGVDSGPVLAQESVPVLASDTPETLHERIKSVEHRLLPEVVRELCAR